MKRKLITGEEVPELKEAKTLTVYTKCPEKWLLKDLETGQSYIGYTSHGSLSWKKIPSDGPEIGSTGVVRVQGDRKQR